MEENTFLDANPNFDLNWYAQNLNRHDWAMQGDDTNAIDRWWHPQIAENAQFERENYFVDKANTFNEYMYNKQNEYNTPAAQMARMKEAGINPMLAAGAIAGNGNTAAAAAPAAQGSAGSTLPGVNPIEQVATGAKTISTLTGALNEAGKIFGFGKENKATIKQIDATANKAAEEADFTFWQKRQFRRTMRIMYDQAQKNLDATEANIKVLQQTYEKLQQEKYNIAADTNLKVAETGEKLENTKNIAYKNAEEEFKKIFRELFGVQLNESDMSMLIQAVLGGHGGAIIDAIGDCFGQIVNAIKNKLPTMPKIKLPRFNQGETTTIGGVKHKVKPVSQQKWDKDFIKEMKYKWEHKPQIRAYWEKRGGFEAYIKAQREIRLNQ